MKTNDQTNISSKIMVRAAKLSNPQSYHSGLCLPVNFQLPENILCFFHNTPSTERQHNRYCIVLPFDRLNYILNGKNLLVMPGQIIMHKPYAKHGIKSFHGGCRRLQISFELAVQQDYFPADGVYQMNKKMWKHIEEIIKNFSRSNVHEASFAIWKICNCFSNANLSPAIPRKRDLLAAVNQIAEFRMRSHQDIKNLAAKLEMSESNLRLRFRKENGISIGHFIQSRKLEMAFYSLRYTNLPISEIAVLCGYDSPFSFSRFFKNQVGVSPLKWRRENQKATGDSGKTE